VIQKRFIPGARSLNEQDLHENLVYFMVPQADIEVFEIFDVLSKLDSLITSDTKNRRRSKTIFPLLFQEPGGRL
jgi:hypothetical protein